jgi:hypothetical protein
MELGIVKGERRKEKGERRKEFGHGLKIFVNIYSTNL